MIIPSEKLDQINAIRERKDIPKLVEKTGLSRSTIYNVLAGSDCPIIEATMIIDFYDQRIALKKALDNKLQDQD